MAGRRERLRAEMLEAIRSAGVAELRRVGAAGLSLREVAERAGISPAGMYRYVQGREGLLELLIADAFEDLAAVVRQATGAAAVGGPVARLEALAVAYRAWALAEPARFALILGTPVVGFEASEDGPTRPAAEAFAAAMLGAFEGVAAVRPEGSSPDGEVTGPHGLPADVMARVVRGWATIHGLVVLELDDQLAWSGVDPHALLLAEVQDLATTLNLTQS
ncbi:MAG: TetR/AcrR family transcriptional regulator [Actinomycetota bacterium]|nr:TetR/AcrR family transcriptional regulator [Actinomycetota bacterium]